MLLSIAVGLLLFGPQTALQTVRFSGEVQKGQNFEREFSPGLLFGLSAVNDPGMPGWMIYVRPKQEQDPEAEFTWVVTPPYRAYNPRYLTVSYGYSAKEIVEHTPRNFRFVKNLSDYGTAARAVRGMPWGEGQGTYEEHLKALGSVPTCAGSLRILDSRVSQSIEWLKFEFELGECR